MSPIERKFMAAVTLLVVLCVGGAVAVSLGIEFGKITDELRQLDQVR